MSGLDHQGSACLQLQEAAAGRALEVILPRILSVARRAREEVGSPATTEEMETTTVKAAMETEETERETEATQTETCLWLDTVKQFSPTAGAASPAETDAPKSWGRADSGLRSPLSAKTA